MPSARVTSSDSISPFAGWLPPLVLSLEQSIAGNTEERAWWFPIRSDSVVSLLGILNHPDPCSTAADRLGAALRIDPALLIYTASLWLADQRFTPEVCRTTDLVRWWCSHGIDRFAEDDVLRNGPSKIWSRMQQLDQYFLTLPPSRWLAQSGLWYGGSSQLPHAVWLNTLQSLRWQDEDTDDPKDLETLRQTLHSVSRGLRSASAMEKLWNQRVQDNRLHLARNIAYGLSHEINNPLAAIVSRAEAILARTEDATIRTGLKRMIQQSYRAHAMIADLMFFAHPTLPKKARFCLKEKVDEVLAFLADELARLQIEVKFRMSSNIYLHADADMLGDAIAAVLQNSIDAIGTGGRIELFLEINQDECCIKIADSGPGVSLEEARQAFDPYFSGREAGRGLGLGLCRVNRILRLHGGRAKMIAAIAGCTVLMSIPATNDPRSDST